MKGHPDVIRRQSASLRTAVTVLFVSLAALVVLERFGWIAVEGAASPDARHHVMHRLGIELVAALPEVFYLLALWWIRSALSSCAAGEFYAPVLTRMLRRVGACVATGAVLNVAVVPSLDRLLGASPGYWIAFDVTGCVLGAIGLSLIILARVLDRARELQTELDAIF